MNKRTGVLILGAGISGCAAAQELQAGGLDYLLLERNTAPGGLTRSINLGQALFDYTGHYLSLNTCRTPEELPQARQKNADWQVVERKSVVYVQGTVVPAPIQYNLFALPKKIREQCLRDYRSRKKLDHPDSFEAYLLSGFGRSLCRIFLFPYNRKQQALDLKDLSAESATRFFPHPDETKIEEGYSRREEGRPVGYNSRFWYPRAGGIGLLAEGLARGLDRLVTWMPVTGLSLSGKTAMTPAGPVRYDRLLSSLPLRDLCALSDSARLKSLGRRLSHNRVLSLNLLVRGRLPKIFEGCQWVYFPEPSIPFYRMGVYSNIPGFPVPESHTAIYLETAFASGRPVPSLPGLAESALSWLEKRRWLNRKDCRVVAANWIDCGYVHFTPQRPAARSEIMAVLAAHGVHLAGRYGLWDYMTMEESILSGVAAARKIMEGQGGGLS